MIARRITLEQKKEKKKTGMKSSEKNGKKRKEKKEKKTKGLYKLEEISVQVTVRDDSKIRLIKESATNDYWTFTI